MGRFDRQTSADVRFLVAHARVLPSGVGNAGYQPSLRSYSPPEQMDWWFLTSLGLKPGSLAVLLVAILTLFAVEWVQEFEPRPVWRLWSRRWIRWLPTCASSTPSPCSAFSGAPSSSTFSSESLVGVGVVEAPKHRQEDDLEVEEEATNFGCSRGRIRPVFPSSRGCRSRLASR